MAKQKTKVKPLPTGMYELYIKGRRLPLIVQLQAIQVGEVFDEFVDRKLTITDPKEGSYKFFIICSKLGVYTSIGADNRHHAANKATKLFGPYWTSLTTVDYMLRGYEFTEVPNFATLLRGLAI